MPSADNNLPEHIIITGAGRGIGKAIALSLTNTENQILCLSQSNNCAQVAKEVIAAGGKADYLVIDIGDVKQSQIEISKWLVENNVTRLGVISAAAILGPTGPLLASAIDDWRTTFNVNLFGNLAIVQAALPIMEKHSYGRIIMFAGGGAAYAYPQFPAYACSKAAIVREVENLAADLAEAGDISAICLAPGAVETDMLKAVRATGAEIRTIGKMDDITLCIKALLGEKAKLFNGKFIHVRDDWKGVIDDEGALSDDHWKLRRVE